MINSIPQSDISILAKGLAGAGIGLTAWSDDNCSFAVDCLFINNPDGTLRWIWPAASKSAPFLKLYHTGTAKATLMANTMRFGSSLGVARFMAHGKCTVYTNNTGNDLLNKLNDWALFTGTTGENRKLVAWYDNGKGSFFAKMPLSVMAEKKIGNEVVGIMIAASDRIVKPTIKIVNDNVLVQSDIYGAKSINAPGTIEDLPVSAVIEWAGTNLRPEIINDADWWKATMRNMKAIGESGHKYASVLKSRLQEVKDSIWKHSRVMVAAAHGDFTPWNVRHDNERMYMIDWEFYATAKPALYDVFHFVYQSNILINRASYKTIRTQIDDYLNLPGIKAFTEENNIDVALTEKLYLLDIISYYLELYSRQEKWHTQIDWLLQTWCEALGHILTLEKRLSPRQAVLQDAVHFLRNTRYAALKLQQEDISLLPSTSDLDMCMDKADAKKLVMWLKEHNAVASIKVVSFSFMNRITMVLADNSFLHLDCIWKMKRKNIVFMPVSEILDRIRINSFGVKTPTALADMRYAWLFHLLNGSSVPERYVAKFHKAIGVSDGARTEGILAYNTAVHNKVLTDIKKRSENSGCGRFSNTLHYLVDTIKSHLPRKGDMITFSGVDGAGKSTIINEISHRIEKELRTPVVVLRHRPSILPIISAWKYGKKGAEMRSVSAMPRTGKNGSSISSYLRFAYYYVDYLLGQFYVQARYVWQGYTVLYDRYYFDFINDSKRSNIEIAPGITKWLYRFLLKPDMNFFLFAPAGIILQRKQELDESTINELTQKYMSLFAALRGQDKKHAYHTVCNMDKNTTLNKIFANIQNAKVCAVS